MVCVSVCVLSKTAEPIEIPFGRLNHVGSRNRVLDGQDWTNPFASARGDMSEMWPFARLLWTLVVVIIICCM